MTYRETYQTQSLFRESKSVSPGRLHKTRDSFGPTLCLINNKNPQTHHEDTSQQTIKMLMLILEVERLNAYITQLVSEKQIRNSQMKSPDSDFMSKQISNLKLELETVEKRKYEEIQRLNQIVYTDKTKIADFETQIKILTRRNEQAHDTVHQLKQTVRDLQEEVSKARTEASRATFNAMMSSQTELQKSTIREKNTELDRFKQKLSQYEMKIDEQKITMINQRDTIERMKNSELETRQRYQYELANMKTDNQNLKDKVFKIQKELSQESINSSENYRKQLRNKQLQIQRLQMNKQEASLKYRNMQEELEKLTKLNIQMKQNQQTQKKQYDKAIEANKKENEEIKAALLVEKKKYDQIKGQYSRILGQNDALNREIITVKKTMQAQISTMNEQLSRKDDHIRRIKKQKKRNQEDSSRLNKSLSQTNVGIRSVSLRNSQSNLKGIIADVIELESSNKRMAKMIENRTNQNTVISSRMFSYASYGL